MPVIVLSMLEKSAGDMTRETMFDHCARNLSFQVTSSEPLGICPTCHRHYTKRSVLHANGPLVDISHVYPEGAGGRVTVLECRQCNNRMNGLGDNEVTRYAEHHLIMVPGEHDVRSTAMFEMSGVEIKGLMYSSSEGPKGHIPRHPGSEERHQQIVDGITGGKPLKVTPTRGLDGGRLDFGYLHSAHLLLFRTFGFTYLRSETAAWVKRQLDAGKCDDDGTFKYFELRENDVVDSLYKAGAALLSTGERLVFASLPHVDPALKARVVLLPNSFVGDAEQYKSMTKDSGFMRSAELHEYPASLTRLVNIEFMLDFFNHARGMPVNDINRLAFMLGVARDADGDKDAQIDGRATAERLGLSIDFLQGNLDSLVEMNCLRWHSDAPTSCVISLTQKSLDAIAENSMYRYIAGWKGRADTLAE